MRTGVYNMRQRYSVKVYSNSPTVENVCDKGNKGGVRTNITTMKWIDCWHKCPVETSKGCRTRRA